MQRSFDIVVIGGGVVGLAILRRLCMSGLSAVLLERGVPFKDAAADALIAEPGKPHASV